MEQRDNENGDEEEGNSVFFDRIHDSSDVKKLADELRDLVTGKGYDKFVEESRSKTMMSGVANIIQNKRYARPNFGMKPAHKAPVSDLGTSISLPKDPNIGPYEVVPQTDMRFKDNNGELKIKTDLKPSLRNTITQDVNPFRNQKTYPGDFVEMIGNETSRMYQNEAMNNVLRYTSSMPVPDRPAPVAPVYDVLVIDKDGVTRKQPTVPVTSVRTEPMVMIPSSKATAPISATVVEPHYTARQLFVENRPVGPPLPLMANEGSRPAYAQVPPAGGRTLPKPLVPTQPLSVQMNQAPYSTNPQKFSQAPVYVTGGYAQAATNQQTAPIVVQNPYQFNDQYNTKRASTNVSPALTIASGYGFGSTVGSVHQSTNKRGHKDGSKS